MPKRAQIFTGESRKPNRTMPFNVKLLGPYKGLAYKGLTTEKSKITWMGQFGPCQVYFWAILGYIWYSTTVYSLRVANFGSMDTVELHGDILQPWGETWDPWSC